MLVVGMRMPMVVAMCLLPVRVVPWPMRVAMSSKNDKSSQVRCQPEAADYQDQLRISNLWRVEESCKRFEDNGYAERNEEDGVEEGAQDFGPEPLADEVSARASQRVAMQGSCSTYPVRELIRCRLARH